MNVKNLERLYLETIRENKRLKDELLQIAPIVYKDNPKLYIEIKKQVNERHTDFIYYKCLNENLGNEINYLKSIICEKNKQIKCLEDELNKYKTKKHKNNRKVKSKEYEEFRKKVLERDNYTCQECGSTNRLQVHHIKSKHEFPELIFDIDNCVTLCITCHSKTGNFFTSKRG